MRSRPIQIVCLLAWLAAGMACEAASVYVSSQGNGTIKEFNALGAYVRTFASGISHPQGIARGSDGSVYVAEHDGIVRVAPNGTMTRFATVGGETEGVALDRYGNLFTVNEYGNTLFIYGPSGNLIRSVTDPRFGSPHGIAFDADGNLFIANFNMHNIAKVTLTGGANPSVVSITTFKEFTGGPMGLAFGPDGLLTVTCWDRPEIRKYDSAGNDLGVVANTGTNYNRGICFGEDGHLFVTNEASGVFEFASDGSLIRNFGNPETNGAVYVILSVPVAPQPVAASLTSSTFLPNGNFLLEGQGTPNVDYWIQATPDMSQDFVTISTVRAGGDGQWEYEDTAAPTFTKRYYRLATP